MRIRKMEASPKRRLEYPMQRERDYMKGKKSFLETHPELVEKTWSKKNTFGPDTVTAWSNKIAVFDCPVPSSGHPDDKRPINNQVTRGGCCAYCRGFKVCESNSLATKSPYVASLLCDYNPFTAHDVTCGSRKLAYFKCPVPGSGHPDDKRPIRDQVIYGGACAYCSGKKVCESNSLAVKNPYIASLFCDYNPFTAYEVTEFSNKKAFFKCPVPGSGHPDDGRQVSEQVIYGGACAYCKGFKVCESNSLATKYPDIAAHEWSEKNKLSPTEVTPFSNEKAFFKCRADLGHPDYFTVICNKTEGSGCPRCRYKGEALMREILEDFLGMESRKVHWRKYPVIGNELDAFFDKIMTDFEYQGRQHHEFTSVFHDDLDDLFKQIDKDNRLRENAPKEGILVIEVPQFRNISDRADCERIVYEAIQANAIPLLHRLVNMRIVLNRLPDKETLSPALQPKILPVVHPIHP